MADIVSTPQRTSALASLTSSDCLTMSSREIADLTGKEHRNVMRDCRTMLVELHGDGGVLSFEQTQINPQNGQPYPVFSLPKRETLILVSGYSVAMRARIIDRWQALEAQAAQPAALNLRDPRQLAAAALQLIEVNQELQARVDNMKVVVAAHERIAKADGSMCITNAAKDLQMRPKDLFDWLKANKWIYRRQGGAGWLAYQDRIQQGVLEHKVTTVEKSDGSEKVVEQVLVTSKGLARLAEVARVGARQEGGAQ
jgi:Rha family phage regulatory protein